MWGRGGDSGWWGIKELLQSQTVQQLTPDENKMLEKR